MPAPRRSSTPTRARGDGSTRARAGEKNLPAIPAVYGIAATRRPARTIEISVKEFQFTLNGMRSKVGTETARLDAEPCYQHGPPDSTVQNQISDYAGRLGATSLTYSHTAYIVTGFGPAGSPAGWESPAQ